jgi:hypothetical protein
MSRIQFDKKWSWPNLDTLQEFSRVTEEGNEILYMDGWYPNRDPNPICAEHTTETNLLDTISSEIVSVS